MGSCGCCTSRAGGTYSIHQPAFAVGVSSGAVSVCGAGQERQSPDHGILIMRELVAWSFMYSLDGLLASEGTAY